MCIPYLLWIKKAFNPNMADHGMHEPLLKFFFKLNATELLQLNIKCHFFFKIWIVCCLCISNKQNTKHQVKLKFKQGLAFIADNFLLGWNKFPHWCNYFKTSMSAEVFFFNKRKFNRKILFVCSFLSIETNVKINILVV